MVRVKRRRRLEQSEPAVLSDLAFILVIFFVLLAVFNVEMVLPLLIGESGVSTTGADVETVRVRITAEGAYRLQGEESDLGRVEQLLATRKGSAPELTLLALVNREAPYGAVVRLVDLARGLEVENFSFQMEAPE